MNSFIYFPVRNIRLTAKTSVLLKRTGHFDLETRLTFAFSFDLYEISPLKEQGIHESWYAYMHAAHTNKP
jgi:hypothetical protein